MSLKFIHLEYSAWDSAQVITIIYLLENKGIYSRRWLFTASKKLTVACHYFNQYHYLEASIMCEM